MGLKDRAKRLLNEQLRPWLLHDVVPAINVSVSEVSVVLPHLEFDADALNCAGMESSPLLIRSMQLDSLQLTLAPFRQSVLAALVQGWRVDLEPRSANDVWWEKKEETVAEQKRIAALEALDPQGAGVHTAAEGLAQEKAGSSLITKFLTSLILTSVRLEFRDCCLRLVSHVDGSSKHVCSIPLSSFEFGGCDDGKGLSWSGGLMGAATAAFGRIWTKNSAPVSKYCVVRGLGLLVETHSVGGDGHESSNEDNEEECVNGDVDGTTASGTPVVSAKRGDGHVVLFEEWVLGVRFMELAMDALEFDVPELAVGLEPQEMHALQILTSQIQGLVQDSPTRAHARHREVERVSELEEGVFLRRSASSLWKKGIQKALELSSHWRARRTFEAAILRSRYSSVYEAWLLELGWGQRQDDGAEHNKRQADHIAKLSEEIVEIQKKLPIEAIALGRRLARRRVSAVSDSNENKIRSANSALQARRLRQVCASFQMFMTSFWRMIVMSTIFVQGKAIGVSMWVSAARRLGVNEWKSISGLIWGSANKKILVVNEDDSRAASGLESTPITIDERICAPENYFQLNCLEDCESEAFPSKKQRRWGMFYALKIRSGSIILASRPIKALHKAKEDSSRLKGGEPKLESALIPALCLSWKEMVLAYGSSGNTSGTSMSCGSLEAELFSLIPSQLSQKLSASLDAEVFHKKFSSLGRWTCKNAERSLLLSSSSCPQRKDSGSQTISGHPLAGEIYSKHWTWQEQHLQSWSSSWTKPRVSQQVNGSLTTPSLSDDNDRPFLIAELNNLDDEPSTDADSGGLTKFSLAIGRLDLVLNGSSFTCLCHLLDQLKMSQKPAEKPDRDSRIREQQNQSQPNVSLQKLWDDSHSQYLNLCRETMVAAIPKKSILFTAVVECPRFRLSATAAELHEHDSNTDTNTGKLKLDSSTQATVVVDIGRFELAMWPPQKDKEVVVETPSQEVGSESRAPKDLWNHAVESKLWLLKPPASAHHEFSQRNRWEHEQVGSNMYICIEGMALTLGLQKESLKELPVFGPLGLVIETSLCWDLYSTLLSTSKSVSASISGKMSPLCVQSYIAEVTVVQQVIGFYAEVMKSPLDHDPIVVVDKGHTFLIVSQEEPVLLSEDSQGCDSKPDSLPSKEVSVTACTLTFSLQLESFRLVLGDSRQKDKASSKSAYGVQGKVTQNGRVDEESKGEMSQAVIDDDGWEQGPPGLVLGREVYVHIQNVSVGASLGDEEDLCVFMRMKDTLVRLVNSDSRSNRSDLAKLRNDFFSASMKSFSGLILAEVALECLSVKAFGASAHQRAVDEEVSKRDASLDEADLTGRNPTLQEDNAAAVDALELSSHLTETDLGGLVQSPFVGPTNATVKLNEGTAEQLITEDQAGPEQQNSIQVEEASNSNPMNGETFWLAADVEVSKVLVTEGSTDVLLAKILLVATGAENLHLHVGVDRSFQKISVGVQGGLVLVHTAAVATFVQFCRDFGDFVARPASPVRNTPESSQKNSSYPVNRGHEDSNQGRSKSNVYRSASAPVLATPNGTKDMKRTSSAPSIAEEMTVADKSEPISLPTFEGVIFSQVAGFSLLLAKQSKNDSEGVLFELELSTRLEVGESAKNSTFDLLRLTILGLPARAPGNSRKAPSRTSSRIPQFSSFKLPYGTDVQSLLDQPNKTLTSLEEASESNPGKREKDQLKMDSSDQSSRDALSSSNQEHLVAAGNDGLKGNDGPQHPASVSEQAEGFHKSLSDFNSFILQRLSVHLDVEKVRYQDKMWKWTNAWNGQCLISGFNVAITTSEVQLLASLVAPLSSIEGSSNKSAGGDGVASDAGVDVTEESIDKTDFEIPDGAIIAIKDVYEHCYLAAEEISSSKGQYRLTGVLHYTLAADRALFKVKYQDAYAKNSTKDAWFSLLSLHAKDADGEPFRVHCRPGSGLADISPSKAGSWEKWRFVPAELSENENSTEVDIQTPTSKHLFHLVNQKNKSGIAFQENAPVIVKQPGNPFKVKIFAKPQDQSRESQDDLAQTEKAVSPASSVDQEVAGLVNSIPRIICTFDTCIFTVLHEAGSGLHLLPLLRVRIPGGVGVIQAGLAKSRTILQCGIVLEHFESQTSRWVSIVNPIETDVFYRARSPRLELAAAMNNVKKCPVALFSRFRKVDVVFSEPSLDACLFLIGALDLAGPYALRYSPVQANRCLVKNRTGVNALCRFDQGSSTDVGGMIPSWHSDSFLMRHMTSRRDSGPAQVASSVVLCLQKSGKGATSPVVVSLGDPGVFAIKTRLRTDAGQKTTGPMVVVDVSRRSEVGIKVTVSPMVRIRNASGLPLEFRCRRNASLGEEGAVVELEDGDTIDDSMAAFDALNLAGELRKALKSLNLGNYFLSVRPAEALDSDKGKKDADFDWSEDIKGATPVQPSGLLDKLQYSFSNSVKAHNLKSTFGTVFCASKLNPSKKKSSGPDHDAGLHFLVRTSYRQVPISRPKTEAEKDQQQGGQYAVVAWQQQQELLLLPTVRVMNLTTSNIKVLLVSTSDGKRTKNSHQANAFQKNVSISSFGTESMYVDLGDLLLTVKQEDYNLTSKPISVGVGIKEFSKNSKVDRARDVEMEVDFGDGIHYALVNVRRGVDGVLEVILLTKYTLRNDSHVHLLCCSARQQSPWWGGLRPSKHQDPDWPSSGNVLTIAPESQVSWFESSKTVLFKRTEPLAEPALLDLESVSGSMEISLRVHCPDSVDSRIQLGVQLKVPSAGDSNPSCIIRLVPRYVVANDSGEAILVCQDGFQDTGSMLSLAPGESSALDAQDLTGKHDRKGSGNEESGPDVLLKVRFRPKESGWNWSGPVFAAAIGSFSVKIRRPQQEDSNDGPIQKPQTEDLWFAVLHVEEKESSLVMSFRRQPGDGIPYRIENALRSAAITYNQQGLENSEVLEAGSSVGYVWDDLGESHTLIVNLAGTSLQEQINPDKLRSWKSFRASRGKKMGLLQIPFLNDLSRLAMYADANADDAGLPTSQSGNLPLIGYEVYADGPTRVVRLCEERDGRVERHWQSDISSPNMEIEIRIPIFTISVVEPQKQQSVGESAPLETVTYVPVICLRLTNGLVQARVTEEYTLCQVKAERLEVDVKWKGAPVAAMLRGHGQDRFDTGHTVLHMAVVMSNLARNPIQLKYASVLLQAIDLNLDEDTLMKLAPFYRLSLSESTAPSRQIYFERFEIHPIKIVGSFLPGKPHADYSSGQETLRALLHSVIKVPTVRGATVELNGVLLSNALLTYKQLALKCAQHYSWYSMRAIYIARGSKLLPPGFASLFDDSAASSLDVFFDPASGSVDLQGLTLGMFGMLKRGLRKKGKGGGTQRYLGDLQHTVKAAGSNILFAAVTEVSDSVLKGADANGFDGVVGGFRRGILNVAMKPSVLRGAVVQGGSTRRIKLDRIVGANEAYIEGYLQAMLDALFKQSYVTVKVMDDQVLLKNLPPNTTLMEEMVQCARDFLIGEGLLAGESSAAALSSLRRLQGEDDRRLGPTVVALCEQLLVIIVVRSLRRQTIRVLRQNNIPFFGSDQPEIQDSSKQDRKEKPEDEHQEKPRQGFFEGINFKRAVTGFALSSVLAYADGRLCRHIPNPLVRRVVSGFLLSFVE